MGYTYFKPIYNAQGQLACVCGADMTFEWLSKELQRIDEEFKKNDLLNQYLLNSDGDFYTVVINNDGSCIVSPDWKKVPLTQEQMANSLAQNKSGKIDLDIKGVPSVVYYGPIDHVNWTVAVVVTKQDIWSPLSKVGLVLLLVAIIGLIAVWMVCRRF